MCKNSGVSHLQSFYLYKNSLLYCLVFVIFIIKNIQNPFIVSIIWVKKQITCWCFMKEKRMLSWNLMILFYYYYYSTSVLHNDNLLIDELIFVMSNWIKCFNSQTQVWTSPCLSLSFRRDSWRHCPSRCWSTVHGDLGTMVVMEERNGELLSG